MVSFVIKYPNLPGMLALAFTFSEILTFYIFDLQKVGQGYGKQFSQWQNSVANVKIYKCLQHSFVLALTISEIQTILNLWPSKNRPRSQNAIFTITQFDEICHNLEMSLTHFCASSNYFRDIKI